MNIKTTVRLTLALLYLLICVTALNADASVSGSGIVPLAKIRERDTTVYVCNKGATKYHRSSDCRGLNACKHDIVKMTKGDAEASGLGLCGWE